MLAPCRLAAAELDRRRRAKPNMFPFAYPQAQGRGRHGCRRIGPWRSQAIWAVVFQKNLSFTLLMPESTTPPSSPFGVSAPRLQAATKKSIQMPEEPARPTRQNCDRPHCSLVWALARTSFLRTIRECRPQNSLVAPLNVFHKRIAILPDPLFDPDQRQPIWSPRLSDPVLKSPACYVLCGSNFLKVLPASYQRFTRTPWAQPRASRPGAASTRREQRLWARWASR